MKYVQLIEHIAGHDSIKGILNLPYKTENNKRKIKEDKFKIKFHVLKNILVIDILTSWYLFEPVSCHPRKPTLFFPFWGGGWGSLGFQSIGPLGRCFL